MELTILMPCLNEAETIVTCIRKAQTFLRESGIDGEVLISDNGSSDGSRRLAEEAGARVVVTDRRGYGSALIYGTQQANGRYIIMGDADDSYDFLHLMPFVEKLREGYDLVMGNRFRGGIEKGAMPFSHRYLGNPVLSTIGRVLFHSRIRDFHCGLRGYNREAFLALDLQTTGMEYASEMVVMAELNGLKICEVPTTLKKDGRSGRPHLRSFRDGWRHLKFLLMYAPDWLFLYPALFFLIAGTLQSAVLVIQSVSIGQITFGIHTLLYCSASIVIGLHILSMYRIVRVFTYNHMANIPGKTDWNRRIRENRIIFAGTALTAAGIALSVIALMIWKHTGYSDLDPERVMRLVIPAVMIIEAGIQNICTGFLIGMMKIRSVGKKD